MCVYVYVYIAYFRAPVDNSAYCSADGIYPDKIKVFIII